ncbi:MAG TPA: cytochrome c3 family protein, partial [Bacillota bacterium]|nr:cytochrome c3 family protein [Bacillota bacterium]
MLLLGSALGAGALDAPHRLSQNATCTICHLDHDQFGNQIGSKAGNANVCLSCHQAGGSASHHALAQSQQAKLWPAVGSQPQSSGTSHRWDASLQGRIESVSGAPLGAIAFSGGYTGRYAASYTLTITSAGNAGAAQFDWMGAGPGAGAGTNVLTGNNVLLESGLAVSFLDVGAAPAFRPGDAWKIMVRPGLQAPGNTNMLHGLANGNLTCATCHNAHSQEMEPFDRQAPPYLPHGGTGRHFLRAQNDQDQMCLECHASRFVTNALAGSHPVGIQVGSNAMVHPPGSLPLDKTAGQMWCSTCHQAHNSPAKDGSLLRKADALCSECHGLADTTTPAIHLN